MAASLRSSIRSDLQDIVGSAYASDASIPQVLPGDEAEVAAVLSYANQHELQVTPRGGGTKASWGNPVTESGLILSTARLNQRAGIPMGGFDGYGAGGLYDCGAAEYIGGTGSASGLRSALAGARDCGRCSFDE